MRFGTPNPHKAGLRHWSVCGKLRMVTMLLPPDFKDFLLLLHSEAVEYLLVGGYAVGFYGFSAPHAAAKTFLHGGTMAL